MILLILSMISHEINILVSWTKLDIESEIINEGANLTPVKWEEILEN